MPRVFCILGALFGLLSVTLGAFGAGALPLVGTAETVAEGLRDLYEAGIDGVLLCFHDFLTDTRRVGSEIVPLMKEIGIAREPALDALARTQPA